MMRQSVVSTTKVRFILITLLGLCTGWVTTPAFSQRIEQYEIGDMKALERAFTSMADKVMPAIVTIRTFRVSTATSRSGNRGSAVSQGAGFVIDTNGFVLTNKHVVENANQFSVTLQDGRDYDAELIQVDVRLDLAVLKIAAPRLTAVTMGDGGNVRINQWAFAMGNPGGAANRDGRSSVTFGVVSAIGRDVSWMLPSERRDPISYYGNLIEFSAPIQAGYSGGPLFNIHGEAVGIVTAFESVDRSRSGSGFAIPFDTHVKKVVERLKKGETIRPAFLGVNIDRSRVHRITPESIGGQPVGALITSNPAPDSPAGKAGLQRGDMIVEFDGETIQSGEDLFRLIGFQPAGATVPIRYKRGGTELRTQVTLGDRLESLGMQSDE